LPQEVKLRLFLSRGPLIALIVVTVLLSLYLRTREAILAEPINSWTEEKTADCGVVLTGGGGRVKEGFSLLAHHSVKRLIISGVNVNASVREIMPNLTFYGDIHEEDIFLDKRSGTTYGNAQQTLPIVEALHCHDILLVTSHLHMARAYQTFRASFPEKIQISKHAILASRSELGFYEVSVEVLKTLFYSTWAY
jgi:uncharacterized SAM-binding protein YcdF (DUF218 family)